MSVPAQCPHCQAKCVVNEIYVGGPVQCYRCKKRFTVNAPGEPATWDDADADAPVYFLHLDIAAATSAGKERDRNEDSFLIFHRSWASGNILHEIALAVVADGMGGHGAGDVASRMAIRTIGNAMTPLFTGALSGQFQNQKMSDVTETLSYAVQEANRAIYRKSESDGDCKGMGSCLAAVLMWDDQVRIEHVGDCRVYLFRDNQLKQITSDHTLVERMVNLGQLSRKEARNHSAKNEVTQALGKRFNVSPDSNHLTLQQNDCLVICCDGLQAHVNDDQLEEDVAQAASSLELARGLVRRANQLGGSDNCTVLAVRCG